MNQMKQTDEAVISIVENIQEAIIGRGGGFIKQRDILHYSVEKLLRLLIPNDIKFKVEYDDIGIEEDYDDIKSYEKNED